MELICPEDLKWRYLIADLEIAEEHSLSLEHNFYRKGEESFRLCYPEGSGQSIERLSGGLCRSSECGGSALVPVL